MGLTIGERQRTNRIRYACSPCNNVTNEHEEILPLKGPTLKWYFKKGLNALAKVPRADVSTKNQVAVVGLVRGCVCGAVSGNIEMLLQKLSSAGLTTHKITLSAIAFYSPIVNR